MRKDLGEIHKEIKKKLFFFENRTIYEAMWENMAEADGVQITK